MTTKLFFYLSIALYCLNLFSAKAQLIAKEKDDKWGYVDLSGKVQIPYQYPFVFTDTLNTIAFVVEAGDYKIKAIDKNNNQLFTVFNYDNGPDYEEEGFFRIVDDNTNKMGFANNQGQIIIAPEYDFVLPFSDGLSAFNIGGEQIQFEDGHSTFSGGKWGFIDHDGKIVFPAIFNSAWGFDHGKVNVNIGGYDFTITVNK